MSDPRRSRLIADMLRISRARRVNARLGPERDYDLAVDLANAHMRIWRKCTPAEKRDIEDALYMDRTGRPAPMRSLGFSSARTGPCTVCKRHCSDIWTGAGVSAFGHRECVEELRARRHDP